MEMVSKMSYEGSRIASVHNGSSLFTGDAGGGESNIRRYIIENDLLECIVQMPNNLFYNTGITTYIWILSNKKTENRKGKVQLIDAGQLYQKLRKNLGNKNCEFSPQHIQEILQTYMMMQPIERQDRESGIASKVFDNADFGYNKVTIERPKRLKAQFSEERIAELRFDKALLIPMKWAYETYGDDIYTNLAKYEKDIVEWADRSELNLSTKQINPLTNPLTWARQRELYTIAQQLLTLVGTEEYQDFNLFVEKVNEVLKAEKIKLSSTQKNAILSAVSWYDTDAEKVIKKIEKIKDDALVELLLHLGCSQQNLADYGYYPTGKKGEYITYETESDLRDSENIPLKENIYDYFVREVKPYVAEAWINLDATKIGYEISFNKYFYQHTPLRSLEEVATDIVELDKASDGLIREILDLA